MNLALISTGVIAVALAAGLLNGLRRGVIKEVTVLVGVLLGAQLVEFWAGRWGQWLTQLLSIQDLNRGRWIVALVLLFGTAIFSGYGSSSLIRHSPIKGGVRVGGGLLGMLNTALLISFALRYTQQWFFNETDPTNPAASWIREGLISRYMVQYIDLVLLGAAGTLAVAALVMTAIRFARLRQRAAAPAKPAFKPAVAPAQPKPQQPQQPAYNANATQPKPAEQKPQQPQQPRT